MHGSKKNNGLYCDWSYGMREQRFVTDAALTHMSAGFLDELGLFHDRLEYIHFIQHVEGLKQREYARTCQTDKTEKIVITANKRRQEKRLY